MRFFKENTKKVIAGLILAISVFSLSIPVTSEAVGVMTDPQTGAVMTGQAVGTNVNAQETGSDAPDAIVCIETTVGVVSGISIEGCAARVAFIFLQFTSWFVYFAAIAFNASLDFGLNMTSFMESFPIVELGWRTFRDLTSIFFVFIILYIAINTILGNSSYGIKALLGKVIIGAILINFSLFFTKVVIDLSNVAALQFYAKIMESAEKHDTTASTGEGGSKPVGQWNSGISAQFANAMGLQTVWNTDAGVSGTQKLALNAGNFIIVGFMGGIFMLSTAAVFLAGAIMFIIRSLVFVFLMTLSPLAFMGNILPSTKGYVKDWWSKLYANAIFAPVYMALMYVTLAMVLGPDSKSKANFIDMFRGDFNFSNTVMTFIILNGLMLGCLLTASKLGATGAGWASSVAGKATFGTAGWLGRNSAGRIASLGADRFAQSSMAGSFLGRQALRGMRGVGNSSFDVRGKDFMKKYNLGKGAEKGFSGTQDDKQKYLEDYGKSLGKAGKAKFTENQLSKPTLGGLINRRNKTVGSSYKVEEIEEKVKDEKEKLREFSERDDVKEFKELVRDYNQGKFDGTDQRHDKMVELERQLRGEQVEFIDAAGNDVKYKAADVVKGTTVNVRKNIDEYGKTKGAYKKTSKSRGIL
ncbi:MAG TPA: hypothetical protein VGE62_00780 [Candidatus Paceibacterota bacterium]